MPVFWFFVIACMSSIVVSYLGAYDEIVGRRRMTRKTFVLVIVSTAIVLGVADEPDVRVKAAIIGTISLLVILANGILAKALLKYGVKQSAPTVLVLPVVANKPPGLSVFRDS